MKKIATTIIGSCLTVFSFATPGIVKETPAKSIAFIENKGQITDQYGLQRPDIGFKVESQGFVAFIGNGQIHYQWNRTPGKTGLALLQDLRENQTADLTTESYRLDVSLIGANKNAMVVKSEEQEYVERYYTSVLNDATVRSYNKITYQDIYPNIDWVIYTTKNASGKTAVKYDFVIRPGGKVSDIKVHYDGATSLALMSDGSLKAGTPMGEIYEQAPYSYMLNGEKMAGAVLSHYALKNNELSFQTGNYTGTLVIDPALEWATYYGGSGFIELSTGLVCDGAANVYMTGVTTSTTNIASTGAHQTTFGGGTFDGYLVKLDAGGARRWATYYGGNKNELTWGVACDKWANIYLSGSTPSTAAIATTGSFQDTKAGTGTALFLVRFDSSGVRKWGTYYGTTGAGVGLCAVDNKGGVFLSGTTTSNAATLTTAGAFQTIYKGGGGDGLLVKFDTACARQWATYFGSDSLESMIGLAADTAGNVFIAGTTKSLTGIATTGSYQNTIGGGRDQYLAKFNGAGNRIWSTYYGGPADDLDGETNTIGTDNKGNVYLSGRTISATGISSPNGFKTTFGGNIDAFLAKFDSAGVRQWATYYGDTAYDVNGTIVTNADGETLLTGYTSSFANMTTPGCLQPVYAGGQYDAFLARFDTDGNRIWGTYFGGPGSDAGLGVTFAQEQSSVYISGTTSSSTGITTPSSFQPVIGGSSSSFIAKLCVSALPVNATVTGNDSICINSTNTYTLPVIAGAAGYVWSLPTGWSGTSNTNTISATANNVPGYVRVRIIKCNDTSAYRSLYVNMNQQIPALINVSGTTLSSFNTFASYQWYFNGTAIPGATGSSYTATQNGDYRLVGISNKGCVDSSAIETISGLSVNNHNGAANSVGLYPNPAKNILYINSLIPVDVLISSMDGKQVLSGNNVKDIDISGLASGVYMVSIKEKDGTLIKVERLVKAAF